MKLVSNGTEVGILSTNTLPRIGDTITIVATNNTQAVYTVTAIDYAFDSNGQPILYSEVETWFKNVTVTATEGK